MIGDAISILTPGYSTVKRRRKVREKEPLTFDQLKPVGSILVLGYTLATISFVVEVVTFWLSGRKSFEKKIIE